MALNVYLKRAYGNPSAENLDKLYNSIETSINDATKPEEAERHKKLELWLDGIGQHARKLYATGKTRGEKSRSETELAKLLDGIPADFDQPSKEDIENWANKETSDYYESRFADIMTGLENGKGQPQYSTFNSKTKGTTSDSHSEPIAASLQHSGEAGASDQAQESPKETENLRAKDSNEAQQGSPTASEPPSTNTNGSNSKGGLESSGTRRQKESDAGGGLFFPDDNNVDDHNGLNFNVDDQVPNSVIPGKALYQLRRGTANLFLIHEQQGDHSRYRLQKTGYDEHDLPHISDQSREHARDNNNRKYGRSQFKMIKDVAWEDYSEDMMSLASIAFLWDDAKDGEARKICRPNRGVKPMPHQPYPWTRCKIEWNDNEVTWETRSFARKLTQTPDIVDQIIFYIAFQREHEFCKATGKPTCKIFSIEAAMCADTEDWQEEHNKRLMEKMEAARDTVRSKVRPRGLDDIELDSTSKHQPKQSRSRPQESTEKNQLKALLMEFAKTL